MTLVGVKRLCTVTFKVSLDNAAWTSRVLLGRWFWNSCLLVILERTLHIHCSHSWGDWAIWVNKSFTQMMALKWSVICNTDKETAHSLFRSPQGTELYETIRFYLENDIEKAVDLWFWEETLHIYCWGLPGHRALQVNRVILEEMCWNGRPLSGDTREETLHSCFWGLNGTEILRSVEFYMEDSLKMAIHQWYWGRHSAPSFFGSPGTQSSLSQFRSTQKMVLKWSFVGDAGEETLVIVQVSQESELICVNRFIFGICVWNDRNQMAAVAIQWDKVLQVSRVILGRWSLMGRTLCHYTGEDCTVTVDSYHGLEMYVFVCSLTKYLNYNGKLTIVIENVFLRDK